MRKTVVALTLAAAVAVGLVVPLLPSQAQARPGDAAPTTTPAAQLYMPLLVRDAPYRVVVCKDDREPCEDEPPMIITATPPATPYR